MLKEKSDSLLAAALRAVLDHYGERLITFAVFGSVGRGTQRPDSDVDLLLVCDPLPVGRMRRIAEFREVEERLEPMMASLEKGGITTSLSVILKTPTEVERGGVLLSRFRAGCSGAS